MTKSTLRGPRTSGVELANVSAHGFWLLLDERELFLGFKDFPWFQDATIGQLGRIERPSPHHLYWPELDVDLAVDSIEHPDRYPLISRARSNMRLQRSKARSGRRATPVRKK
jgi:hypothetical protein